MRSLAVSFLAGWVGMALGATALAARQPDGGSTGPELDKEAVPFWKKPAERDRERLGAVTRANAAAVLLVGDPKVGHGTAWVLSRRHRLLVSNAHVADILAAQGHLVAIVNGSQEVHTVEKVWYHPGVRRKQPGGRLSVRSECPKDGEIFAACPDLAVLQLADGPPLQAELAMATPGELQELMAQPVGMLGFPGYDTSWPALGEKAQGTYHSGVVSRLTDFRFGVSAPAEELQFVQHTMANFGGFSGAPIYLPNGHVVAVNNSARSAQDRGMSVTVSQGIRVDCLWELLVHHGLDAKVAVPVDKSKLQIARWRRVDEGEKKFRRAAKLVEEAAFLIDYRQKFEEGIEKCTEAIGLAPDYPDAYRVRCAGRNNYYFYGQLSRAEGRQVLKEAIEDARAYAKFMSSDPRWLTATVNTANNLAELTRNPEVLEPSLEALDKALGAEGLPGPQRAEFYSLRGMCRFNLGDRGGARADFNESVRLDPQNDLLFDNRARFWEAVREDDRADDDRLTARRIREERLRKARERD